MIVYFDTSAATKPLAEEKQSAMLGDHRLWCARDGNTLVAPLLLGTELRCAESAARAYRAPDGFRGASAIALIDIENAT